MVPLLSALLALNGVAAVLNLTSGTSDTNELVGALNVVACLFILGILLGMIVENTRSK